MICVKVQKKDGQLIHLIGLEETDLKDISVKDAVITFSINGNKVSIVKVAGTRDEFMANLHKLSGLNDEQHIITK